MNANFEDADARGASFEDTSMDNANLRNINAAGAYFGQSLLDVQTMEGGDFTDAQSKFRGKLVVSLFCTV